jgi:ABC-type bacteriocin/lantibiotic exporter with double-glycine peptidase domain
LKDKSKYIQKKVEAEEKKVEFINSVEKIKLTDIEKKILEQFKKYNLKQIDLHPRLFDLT